MTTMIVAQLQLCPKPPARDKNKSNIIKINKPIPPSSSSSSSSSTNKSNGQNSSASSSSSLGLGPGLIFREKILFLENELRIDSSRALSVNPALRSAPLSSVHSVVDFLSSYRISPTESSRIFQMYPQLLTCDPSAAILPVLRFLSDQVGIPFHDLRKSVTRCPRLLVSSIPLQLRPALYFLRRLGFTGPHRISAHTTLLLVSDVERTLIPKLDFLRSLGFSHRDTVRMVLRSPRLLTFSIDNNFRPKRDYLLRDMARDVNELRDFPQYFSCSLEAKIKPRHRALLESGLHMSLADMLRVSDGEFRENLLEMRLKQAADARHG